MNPLTRWLRFNLVGAMGMALQLGALWVFARASPAHALAASAAAVEVAILHNFLWHLNYTWGDRRGGSSASAQLLRFHLSNGLVSLAGNLVLTRVLLAAHLPLLMANLAAIGCCAVLNFALSHTWAFAQKA